jgi:lipoyl(octanoyl) transferase
VSGITDLNWAWLGRVGYGHALSLQKRLREQVLAGESPGALLLLEHPPVLTIGRHGNPRNIVAPPGELARRGVEVHRVERGGDVTFHGPGQLVGYPVLPVRGGVQRFVRALAEAAAEVLLELGIPSRWEPDRPGLWTDGGKIAAVGIHVARGIATHGIALNVDPDLRQYELIVPCGLSGAAVTSIARLRGTAPPLPELAERFARAFRPGSGPVRPEKLAHSWMLELLAEA